MDKKENKRSLKIPPYFQYRSKKSKKSLLFSATSAPSFKPGNHYVLKKQKSPNNPIVRSIGFYQEPETTKKQNENKKSRIGSKGNKKTKHSTSKIMKQDNKFSKPVLKNHDYYWSRQRTIECSKEKCIQTPKGNFDSQLKKRSSQDLIQSRSLDVETYQKQIRQLEGSIHKYQSLHKHSLKKLSEMEERAKQEETKFERVKQIYIERIKTLSKCLQSSQRNLGHLFTYEQMDKNIVPEKIILQVSIEDKSEEIRELENQMRIFEEYYKSTESSMISQISLNSRTDLD